MPSNRTSDGHTAAQPYVRPLGWHAAKHPMTTIESRVTTGSDDFARNRDGMLSLLERLRGIERRVRDASAASRERFEKRGQLLPRERLALLLDPGTAFLELA